MEREGEGEKCEGEEEKEGESKLEKGNKGMLLLKAIVKGIICAKVKIAYPHGV